jgi:hypothetical protein
MTSPGEVYAQISGAAVNALSELSKDELLDYKSAIKLIASKYNRLDERLGGLTAEGKLEMIVLVEESTWMFKWTTEDKKEIDMGPYDDLKRAKEAKSNMIAKSATCSKIVTVPEGYEFYRGVED